MLTHFSISQQGQRHVEKDVPCQDNSYSCRLHIDRFDKDVIIAAVADGVGSCMFSQDGSKAAVEGFFECVGHNLIQGKNINEFNDESIEKIIRHAFRYALAKVIHVAEEKELPFIEFDTTLTGVVYDGENLWFGHVGDDGVVALYTDGQYEMVTSRHKGEEASSVFPLRAEDHWQFGKAPKSVASAVLMTDGVLDYCVGSEKLNNRVYYPFLEPALTEVMADDEAAYVSMKDWDDYLGGSEDYPVNFRSLVTDDISFAVIQNSEAVKNLPEIFFDSIKWDEDTAKYREELRKALYGDPKKNQPQQPVSGQPAPVAESENPESDTGSAEPNDQSGSQDETAPAADKADESTAPVVENNIEGTAPVICDDSESPAPADAPAESIDNDTEKKASNDPVAVALYHGKAIVREFIKQVQDAFKPAKESNSKKNEQSQPQPQEAPEAEKESQNESDNGNKNP